MSGGRLTSETDIKKKSKIQPRSSYTREKITKLELGEERKYVIEHDKHKECDPAFEENHIKKVDREDSSDDTDHHVYYFLVSLDAPNFPQISDKDIKVMLKCTDGYAKCSTGQIHNVHIFRGKRCGIATVLSVLCMIDDDVNPGEEISLDLDKKISSLYDGVATRKKVKIVIIIYLTVHVCIYTSGFVFSVNTYHCSFYLLDSREM